MELVRRVLTKLPAWIFSVVTVMAILWLTLAPQPLGEEPPPLFPGADKIAHGIMFGGLTVMFLLDWQRKHGWHRVVISRIFFFGGVSAIFGVLIEYAQAGMGLGRSLEYEDMIADAAGAFLCALLWMFFQGIWILTERDRG